MNRQPYQTNGLERDQHAAHGIPRAMFVPFTAALRGSLWEIRELKEAITVPFAAHSVRFGKIVPNVDRYSFITDINFDNLL